jgi:thiol-disulfide isomerase/thioredoxin
LKGTPSPEFNFENHKGGTTKLSDIKGKYVYIDIWATWCAPCRQEIPYLQKIEKKYEDKRIAFVSISIDQKIGL